LEPLMRWLSKICFTAPTFALDLPPAFIPVFEANFQSAVRNDLGRITEYYGERNGGFWVAEENATVVGMLGIVESAPAAMQLRRLSVAPEARRQGIARTMLAFAATDITNLFAISCSGCVSASC
jgi:putative acetyltransferase